MEPITDFWKLCELGSDAMSSRMLFTNIMRLPLATLLELKEQYDTHYAALVRALEKLSLLRPECFATSLMRSGPHVVERFLRDASAEYKRGKKRYRKRRCECGLYMFFPYRVTSRIRYLQERELPTVILVYANEIDKEQLYRKYGYAPSIDLRDAKWKEQLATFPLHFPLIVSPGKEEILRREFPQRKIVHPTYSEEHIQVLAITLSYLEGKELIDALRSLPPEEAVRILRLHSIIKVPPVEYDSDRHYAPAPPDWPCAPLVAINVHIKKDSDPNDPAPINAYLRERKDLLAYMQRGDVIINLYVRPRRNNGVFIWSGAKAIPLDRELDKWGDIPTEFCTFTEFPFGYFFGDTGVRTLNIDLAPYYKEMVQNREYEKTYFTVEGKRYGMLISGMANIHRMNYYLGYFRGEDEHLNDLFGDWDVVGIIHNA